MQRRRRRAGRQAPGGSPTIDDTGGPAEPGTVGGNAYAGTTTRARPPMIPIALGAILGAILIDLASSGPLMALDLSVARLRLGEASPLRAPAGLVDHVGLRGVTVPVLALCVLWLRRRSGSWRPLGPAAVALLAVNVTVGVMKLLSGRRSPLDGDPDLFTGGILWPSGHAANVAMTGCLVVYLLRRYGNVPIGRLTGWAVVAVPTAAMTTVSVLLGYHWLTDLLAGSLVGLLVTDGAIRVDVGPGVTDRLRAAMRRFAPGSRIRSSPPASLEAGRAGWIEQPARGSRRTLWRAARSAQSEEAPQLRAERGHGLVGLTRRTGEEVEHVSHLGVRLDGHVAPSSPRSVGETVQVVEQGLVATGLDQDRRQARQLGRGGIGQRVGR